MWGAVIRPWVGVGGRIKVSAARVVLRVWKISPGTSAGSWGPKWVGETLAMFSSNPPYPEGLFLSQLVPSLWVGPS